MAQDYRQASRAIWDQMAAGWADDRRWIWDASRPVGEWLVDALDPQPGGAPRSSGSRTVRSLPDDEQAAVRRFTEERLRPMVRPPGSGLGGVCLNVLAE